MFRFFVSFLFFFLPFFVFSEDVSHIIEKKSKEIDKEIELAISLIDSNIEEARKRLEEILNKYYRKGSKPINIKELQFKLWLERKKRYEPPKLESKFKPFDKRLFLLYKTLG